MSEKAGQKQAPTEPPPDFGETAIRLPDMPPEPPSEIPAGAAGDFTKLEYSERLDAWLETWKQQVAADTAKAALDASREDADRAADAALVKSVHDAYLAVSQSAIDRSLTRVNVLTASIGTVTTIYTGLLALVYAAKSDSGKALTPAAITPALFLGLALLLVTVYAAMFRNSSSLGGPRLPSGTGDPLAEYRVQTFMGWCFAAVGARLWALHAGIASLGVGIVSLPIPFVKLTGTEHWIILIAGILIVAACGLATQAGRNN
ncbi:MAG: hypothetical protein JO016_20355 [Actinobacteria bacterium]|nr:hypothetical protein [Actinomycetota bacterium]